MPEEPSPAIPASRHRKYGRGRSLRPRGKPAVPETPTRPEASAPETPDKPNDYWTKVAAVVISSCALIATAGSCIAAWQSWRTAHSAERIARDSLELGGPVIKVDASVSGEGDCRGNNPGSVTLRFAIANSGRLAAEVRSRLFVEAYANGLTGGLLNLDPLTTEVRAQSIRTVTTTMSCEMARLRQQGSSLLSEGGEIEIEVQTGGGDWVSTVVQPENVIMRCRVDDDTSWPSNGYGPC